MVANDFKSERQRQRHPKEKPQSSNPVAHALPG
jgi:hypothetical protein